MLIDLKSLNKAEQNTKEPENQPVLFLSVPECRNLADSETSLRKQIGILEHNVCINFWSYGSFSLHELMFYILQQTGPAHINMCTWSISQDAIEKIIRKYQKGETFYKITLDKSWNMVYINISNNYYYRKMNN